MVRQWSGTPLALFVCILASFLSACSGAAPAQPGAGVATAAPTSGAAATAAATPGAAVSTPSATSAPGARSASPTAQAGAPAPAQHTPGATAIATPEASASPGAAEGQATPAPSGGQQVASEETAPLDSKLGFGVQVFLWGHPDTTERDLRLAREAGFTWVKQRFEWRYIQPESRRKFEWDEADRIIAAVEAAGLQLIARVDNQPRWARDDGLFPEAGPPDNLEDWKDFLEEFAARYRGRVHAYQIWNEPNLAREWGGKRPEAREYAEMLRISYQAIKGADPDALVISAGLSPTTDDVSGLARPDLYYLRELYAAGARDSFDMLGVHAAGYKAEPEADPGAVAKDPDLTNNDPSTDELKRSYAFRHVEDLRQVMEENGDAGKPVAILETGWTSDTRPGSSYAWFGVSEERKAEYLVRAIRYARENWPWLGLMTFIYLPDPTWTPDDEQYYWSLTDPDGTPRPAYEAIRGALR